VAKLQNIFIYYIYYNLDFALELSVEEIFLNHLLFSKKIINKYEFKKINFELFVKIGSSNYLLPLIYYKLKKKKILHLVPDDLQNYLKEIYTINKQRNAVLIEEIETLTNFFKTKKLFFVLLKGSHNIMSNLYLDNGERMVGDIDFLVRKSDLKKVKILLNLEGYFNKFNYKIWKTKHPPRFVNSKKIFALEPHTELLIYRKRKHLRVREFIKKLQFEERNNYLIKYMVLNYQINDYGHLYGKYNLRNIYDVYVFMINKKIEIKNFKNKYFRRFFLITNVLGVTNLKIEINFFDKLYMARFKLKKSNFLYYLIDKFICDIVRYLPIRFMQLVEFTINKDYRNKAFSK